MQREENYKSMPGRQLQLFLPTDILVWLTFFSPIIVAAGVTSLSFVFQNAKGLLYLVILLVGVVARNYGYYLSGSNPTINTGGICTAVEYSKYGNSTFSAFVFAFTIAYLSIPMFTNGAANMWVFVGLLTYFAIDIFIKFYNQKCITSGGALLLDIVCGLGYGAIIVAIMSAAGIAKFLFFNEVSSNKEMCYQPKEQTFKCQVYKDGVMVGNI